MYPLLRSISLNMRICLSFFFFVIVLSLKGNPPIYFFTDLIRVEQALWQQKNFDRPDGHVKFEGLYGFHPAVYAKYGLDVKNMDSLRSFSVAQSLWLDYMCEFRDSLEADIAMIYGPVLVKSMSKEKIDNIGSRINKYKHPEEFQTLIKRVKINEDVVEKNQTKIKRIKLSEIPKFTVYTVKKGDNLWKISRKYPSASIDKLIEINKNTDVIYPGQKIRIPL